MDWYLETGDLSGVGALRRQVRDYLSRHCEPGSDVDSAELVAQELVANAVEHALGPVWVRLTWRAAEPDLEVWDLGPGFSLPSGPDAPIVAVADLNTSASAEAPYVQPVPQTASPRGRGLFLVGHLATDFDVTMRRGGGTRASARLPVQRAASREVTSLLAITDPLPELSEAAEGGFGKEAFLRALVVQLSQAMQHSAGPQISEDVVTSVGVAVGGQMEAAYRATRNLTGRLTPAQLADCYVGLKHAIDGQFRIVEVSDERIVLDNTRCPFGNAVRKAPALCQMTSSVFGGIAARNRTDGAAVLLEERIAVGDPGCRVVIYLGKVPTEAERFAHPYASPAAP